MSLHPAVSSPIQKLDIQTDKRRPNHWFVSGRISERVSVLSVISAVTLSENGKDRTFFASHGRWNAEEHVYPDIKKAPDTRKLCYFGEKEGLY